MHSLRLPTSLVEACPLRAKSLRPTPTASGPLFTCPQAFRSSGGGGSGDGGGSGGGSGRGGRGGGGWGRGERRTGGGGRERWRDARPDAREEVDQGRRRDDGGPRGGGGRGGSERGPYSMDPDTDRTRFGSDGSYGRSSGAVRDGGRRDGYRADGADGGGGGGSGWRSSRDAEEARGRDRPVGPSAPSARGGNAGAAGSGGASRYEQSRRAPPRDNEEYDDSTADDAEYEDEYEDDEHGADARREGGAGRRDWRQGRSNFGAGGGGGGPPPLRDSLQGEALYGVFPVLAALKSKRRKVHRAFMLESIDLSKRKDAGLIRQVESLCRQGGVEVVRTSRHELNLMSYDRPHQGLVLDVSALDWAPLDEFPSAEEALAAAGRGAGGAAPAPPVWLALDEVVDPQNLGAVVRSAYCLGAAGVLACSRNCAPLSPVVSKASAGALEALPLHSCHNMPRTLMDARDNKGWVVLGAAAGGGSQPVGAVRVTRPTILVLGSEGFGLRTNVRRACSGLVRVEMAPPAAHAPLPSSPPHQQPPAPAAASAGAGAAAAPQHAEEHQQQHHHLQQQPQQHPSLRGLVDSLNVSVATGILLHSLLSSAASGSASAAGGGGGGGGGEGGAAAAGSSPGAGTGAGGGAVGVGSEHAG